MSADALFAIPGEEVTFGRVMYLPPSELRRRGGWGIDAKPYVMIRAKRLFPRAKAGGAGAIAIFDSPEVCRDLEWLLERHPMVMSPYDRARLAAGAAEHRDTEDTIAMILSGQKVHSAGMRVPAQKSREYQVQAADVVTTMRRTLCTDELGLGKTHTGALTFRNPDSLPGLVVCPTQLPRQWQRQMADIWPDLTTYIPPKGTPDQHLENWTRRNGGPPDVFILPYSKLAGWQHHLQPVIRSVVFDEVQELRNGTTTDRGTAAANLTREASYVVGLSATPVYNYAGDLHSIYSIVQPDALGSRDEFLREWGGASVGMSGKHISVKDPKALSIWLRDSGLMIGRTRTEVDKELPYGPAVKVPHYIDADPKVLEAMTGDAVELARIILSSVDKNARFVAAGELDSQLRLATGLAKAPFVAAFVANLIQSEAAPKVVLWGWHHAVYDVWRERLARWNIRAVTYTGKESLAGKERSVQDFLEPDGAQVLMMSTRSGAGLDGLQEVCHVGVFGELDWSPKIMDQCLGRLARDGQEREVVGYYLMAESGADPEMAKVLNLKEAQAAPIEDPHAAVMTALPDGTNRMRELAQAVLRQAGEAIP